jgi:hypothetical protein
MEKLNTGGTAPKPNREDAWRIVPSPPRVTTRSIGSEFWPTREYDYNTDLIVEKLT